MVRIVDRLTGREVHRGRVSAVLDAVVVVESPRGCAWHFRRRDGEGIGAVDDLRIASEMEAAQDTARGSL